MIVREKDVESVGDALSEVVFREQKGVGVIG
jgi:hypothetical protein